MDIIVRSYNLITSESKSINQEMSKQCIYGLQYSEINYSLFYTEFEIRISRQRAKGFLTIFLLKT